MKGRVGTKKCRAATSGSVRRRRRRPPGETPRRRRSTSPRASWWRERSSHVPDAPAGTKRGKGQAEGSSAASGDTVVEVVDVGAGVVVVVVTAGTVVATGAVVAGVAAT